MTWLEALRERKDRLEHELGLVVELVNLAAHGEPQAMPAPNRLKPDGRKPKGKAAPATAPQPTPEPKPADERPQGLTPPSHPKFGRVQHCLGEILTRATFAGKPTMTAMQIAEEVERNYGVHWASPSSNMASLVKGKDCPIERAGKGVYRLKPSGGHKDRWLGGGGTLCDDKGTVTGKDGEDEG